MGTDNRPMPDAEPEAEPEASEAEVTQDDDLVSTMLASEAAVQSASSSAIG